MGRMTHSPIQGRQLVLILGLVFVGTLVLPPLAAWRLNQHRIDETTSTARAAAASVAPRIAALALAHPDIEVAVGPGLLPAAGEGGQATWIDHAVFASEVFGEQMPADAWGQSFLVNLREYSRGGVVWILSAGANGRIDTPYRAERLGGDDIGVAIK